jgi:signal transduction histidine kinase
LKLRQWSRLQTIGIIKQSCVSVGTILVPICASLLIWSQSSHVHTLVSGNQQVIMNALQTGDLIQLNRSLFGIQLDEKVYGYDLLDRSGNSVKSYRASDRPLVYFNTNLPILDSRGESWGTIQILWPPPWISLAYFIFASIAIVVVVGFVVYKSWNRFATQLVGSMEHLKDFSKTNQTPELLEQIDDLKSVFNSLKSLQAKEISIAKLKFELEKDQELVSISHKVAHDLKSPMSALSIVLGTSNLDQGRHKIANGALQRMSEICDELLKKKRSSRDTREDIRQAVDQVVHEFQLRNTDIEIRSNVDASLNGHMIPDYEFKSVLSNLLNNASEACGIDGNIQLKSTMVDNCIKIEVTDNGHGIPAHVMERLGSHPTSHGKKENGNGVGVYNAANWAKRNGGKLSIFSNVNEGTQVYLEIPLNI